ncbi:MAG: YhgE/Pip family protein, partial [Actinomycetes bacterium]
AQALTQQVDTQFAATTLSGLKTIRASLVKAAAGAQQLAGGLDQAKTGSDTLASGAGEVAGGDEQLAAVANQVRSGLSVASDDLTKAVSQAQAYASSHPGDVVAAQIAEGLGLLRSRFDTVVTSADSSIAQIDKLGAGAGQLASGASQLSSGIAKLDAGAHELATGLAQGVDQIPTYTPAQQSAVSAMVANPVSVSDQAVNPSASYGTGFAPYFMPLALWVGTLVAYMLFQPLPTRSRLSQYQSSTGVVLTGMTPMVLVGIAQVVVLSLVLRYFVGVEAVHPLLVGGISLLVSLVFLAVIQLLMVALDAAGRLVALVLLMLQLCSSGGTYPVSLSPWFFREISPFLPMTYAVDALRRSINGGELGPVVTDCLMLALFGAGAFLLTVLTAMYKRRFTISDLKPEIAI